MKKKRGGFLVLFVKKAGATSVKGKTKKRAEGGTGKGVKMQGG